MKQKVYCVYITLKVGYYFIIKTIKSFDFIKFVCGQS